MLDRIFGEILSTTIKESLTIGGSSVFLSAPSSNGEWQYPILRWPDAVFD